MVKTKEGISALNTLHVSNKEVVTYLQSLEVANEQILAVLRKEPSLPEYEKLPWVLEMAIDKKIILKLILDKALSPLETVRLKEVLTEALVLLKRGHKVSELKRASGLQNYINGLA